MAATATHRHRHHAPDEADAHDEHEPDEHEPTPEHHARRHPARPAAPHPGDDEVPPRRAPLRDDEPAPRPHAHRRAHAPPMPHHLDEDEATHIAPDHGSATQDDEPSPRHAPRYRSRHLSPEHEPAESHAPTELPLRAEPSTGAPATPQESRAARARGRAHVPPHTAPHHAAADRAAHHAATRAHRARARAAADPTPENEAAAARAEAEETQAHRDALHARSTPGTTEAPTSATDDAADADAAETPAPARRASHERLPPAHRPASPRPASRPARPSTTTDDDDTPTPREEREQRSIPSEHRAPVPRRRTPTPTPREEEERESLPSEHPARTRPRTHHRPASPRPVSRPARPEPEATPDEPVEPTEPTTLDERRPQGAHEWAADLLRELMRVRDMLDDVTGRHAARTRDELDVAIAKWSPHRIGGGDIVGDVGCVGVDLVEYTNRAVEDVGHIAWQHRRRDPRGYRVAEQLQQRWNRIYGQLDEQGRVTPPVKASEAERFLRGVGELRAHYRLAPLAPTDIAPEQVEGDEHSMPKTWRDVLDVLSYIGQHIDEDGRDWMRREFRQLDSEAAALAERYQERRERGRTIDIVERDPPQREWWGIALRAHTLANVMHRRGARVGQEPPADERARVERARAAAAVARAQAAGIAADAAARDVARRHGVIRADVNYTQRALRHARAIGERLIRDPVGSAYSATGAEGTVQFGRQLVGASNRAMDSLASGAGDFLTGSGFGFGAGIIGLALLAVLALKFL